jgi:5-methylcytosine-specific restriction protein A
MTRQIPTHKRVRPRNTKRRPYDARWAAFGKRYLARHPECVACGMPARHVDHIVSLESGGAKYLLSNLQALCIPCHSRKGVQCDGLLGRAKSV